MKNLLLVMLLLSSMSYAESVDILPNSDENMTSSNLNEVQFESKLNKTKWEILEGNKKVIFEFDSPYIITKVYKDSILENVTSTKILHYNKINDLHFLFHDENSLPITFHRIKKKILHRIIIDNTSVTNIILTPNKK